MRGKRERKLKYREMRAYFRDDRVFGMNIRTEIEPMIVFGLVPARNRKFDTRNRTEPSVSVLCGSVPRV